MWCALQLACAAHVTLPRAGALGAVRPAARASGARMQQSSLAPCVIKVVGVGGGGGNAINRMIQFGQDTAQAVEFWSINTDIQALDASLAPNRLGLGAGTSRGLGAGGSPDTGKLAAEESYEQIGQMVAGSDMVFVVAGMGGGTGSGAGPVVAEAAKAAGCLTVGVVTKPFTFEGQRRMRQAEGAIERLKAHVDAMIVVSNDRLLDIVEEGTPLQEAFCVADDILRQVSRPDGARAWRLIGWGSEPHETEALPSLLSPPGLAPPPRAGAGLPGEPHRRTDRRAPAVLPPCSRRAPAVPT